MPRYVYKCADCEFILEVKHSIKEKLKDCPRCDLPDVLKRLPTSFTIRKTGSSTETSKKVGKVTKEKIEQFREELETEKKNLKNEEFK